MTSPGVAPGLLRVQGLCSGYGRSQVLFGVDLHIGEGEILGVLGRNGMGKTTLVRSIMGLLRPTGGTVELGGRAIVGLAPHRVARQGIAVVPEGRQVFANLSVLEHLTAFARGGHGTAHAWTIDRLLHLFPRLAERRSNLGGQLSGGEQQMLAIARALATNPRLLILDEATEGLAPLVREEVWHALSTLRQAGMSMLVIDKYVRRLIGLADRHVILEKGEVAWTGSSAQLEADRSLWSRHLGL
ncbi:ABC transporter ATP-binding protein [Ramlibacter sp.]|uniref:ABC transporter ATP-binding protein n=1 Tax=Ramlibacter sp. TaxID=1917967 RepID=UPI002FC5CBE8